MSASGEHLVSVIVAGISIIICPFLISFLYTQQYADSVFYAQLLFINVIVGVPFTILIGALLPAHRKTKEIYIIKVTYVVIYATLLVGLVVPLGILGVVLARVVAGIFISVFAWWHLVLLQ